MFIQKKVLQNKYDSDGEPEPFCVVEYLEYDKYIYEDALLDVFPLVYGEYIYNDEVNESI